MIPAGTVKEILIRVRVMAKQAMSDMRKVTKTSNKELEEMTTTSGKLDKRFGLFGTRIGRLLTRLKLATGGMRGFRMEMLSVMFFGMGLSAFFTGLIRPAGDAVGLFDLWSTILTVLFLPIALTLLPFFISLLKYIMEMPEETKLMIGQLVVLGIVFGTLLMLFGMTTLGIGGIMSSTTSLSLVLGAGAAAFLVLAASTLGFGAASSIFGDEVDGLTNKANFMGFDLLKISGGVTEAIGNMLKNIDWVKLGEGFDDIVTLFDDMLDELLEDERLEKMTTLGVKMMVNLGKAISEHMPDIIAQIWDGIMGGLGNKEASAETPWWKVSPLSDLLGKPRTWNSENQAQNMGFGDMNTDSPIHFYDAVINTNMSAEDLKREIADLQNLNTRWRG